MKLKLLLVDDEPGVLRFFKHIIDNNCCDWIITDLVENGKQALDSIEQNPPDLVLTDIRMPVMNGVKLAEQIHRLYGNIQTVIISGYEDFEVAKSALRLGVVDYLLKPVDPIKLVELLDNLKATILQQKHQSIEQIVIRSLVGDYIEGYDRVGDISTLGNNVNDILSVDCMKFRAAIIRVSAYYFESPTRMSVRLQPVCATTLMPSNCFLFSGSDDYEMLLFELVGDPISDNFSGNICTAKKLFANLPTTTLIQDKPFSLSQSQIVLRELTQNLHASLVLGVTQKIYLENCPIIFKTNAAITTEIEQRITSLCIGVVRMKELNALVNDLFDRWFYEGRPLKHIHHDVVQIIHAVARGLGDGKQHYKEYQQQLNEIFSHEISEDNLKKGVWVYISRMISGTKTKEMLPSSEEFFDEVQAYILKNLSNSITLSELCSVMGISQTYMSKIFRRFCGKSFAEYVTILRMDYAKELMTENPNLLLTKVSELCGYKDPLYFSKVFRNREGIPPSQFVENLKPKSKSNLS